MVTTLLRIIKYGFQGFLRNVLLSAATILVIVLALLVFESLLMFNELSGRAVASLEDKIDISVYFKTTAKEDSIFELEKALEGLEEVKDVEYISREKALEEFKKQHGGDATISQALEELGENPLLASLNVKARNLEDYAAIAGYLEGDSFRDLIQKVTYSQSQRAIERLDRIARTFERIGFIVSLFVALVAALVTFNTIQLAIYSNREEITVMRLVGASNVFINGPYIVEGIIYGVLASVVAIAVAIPIVASLDRYVNVFIPDMNFQAYFYGNIFSTFGSLLLFGVLLGVLSSVIAVRRYLKA